MTEQTTSAPPPPAMPGRPPLRRSESDKVIAGVAGGFARWLGIDPVIVRVVLVVLAVFGGSGLLLYVIGWAFIPAESQQLSEVEGFLRDRQGKHSVVRVVVTVALVFFGLILAMSLLGAALRFGPLGNWGGGGAFLLFAASAALVIYLVRRPQSPTQWQGSSPAATQTEATPSAFAYGGAGQYPTYVPVAVQPPAPPRPTSYLGLATLSVAVIAAGILAAISAGRAGNVPAVVVLAVPLGILGVGLLVGTFYGRARWLVALAVPLLVVTSIAAAVPRSFGTRLADGTGSRNWLPTSATELQSTYVLGLGSESLVLTRVNAPNDLNRTVTVTLAAGQLRVLVPPTMRVFVDAHVDMGRISVRDLVLANGTTPSIDSNGNIKAVPSPIGYFESPVLDKGGRNLSASVALPDNPSTGPTLNLVLNANFGTVEVSRVTASN